MTGPVPTSTPGSAPGSAPGQATADLGRRQAELVAALVAGGPPPAGFDDAALLPTRRALLRKRAAGAAREWPLLAHSLGPEWTRVFARHREGRPPVGALRDGWHVARELRERGELPTAAAGELAAREAELRYDGRTPPRRRRLAAALRVVAALRTGRGP